MPSVLRDDLDEQCPQGFSLVEWEAARQQREELERRAGPVDVSDLLVRYLMTKAQELHIEALASGATMSPEEAKVAASKMARGQPKMAKHG